MCWKSLSPRRPKGPPVVTRPLGRTSLQPLKQEPVSTHLLEHRAIPERFAIRLGIRCHSSYATLQFYAFSCLSRFCSRFASAAWPIRFPLSPSQRLSSAISDFSAGRYFSAGSFGGLPLIS